MDIAQVISELRFERAKLAAAIESLERLSMAKRRGPGRPPKSATRHKTIPRLEWDPTGHATLAAGR